MGFSVPRRLLAERWALTPPFHPYRCTHSPSGGLFSVALSVKRPFRTFCPRVSRFRVTRHRALRSSDFPPPACAGSDSPPFQNQLNPTLAVTGKQGRPRQGLS